MSFFKLFGKKNAHDWQVCQNCGETHAGEMQVPTNGKENFRTEKEVAAALAALAVAFTIEADSDAQKDRGNPTALARHAVGNFMAMLVSPSAYLSDPAFHCIEKMRQVNRQAVPKSNLCTEIDKRLVDFTLNRHLMTEAQKKQKQEELVQIHKAHMHEVFGCSPKKGP